MLIKIIDDLNLTNNLLYSPQVPRNQALEYTFNSQVLLLILNMAENNKGRMPGKLFEYLRSSRPIICLGPENSDVSQILKETNSGSTYDYEESSRQKALILEYYKKYKKGNLSIVQENISQYSMLYLFKKISTYLDQILQNNEG